MGAFVMLTVVSSASVALCILYSALDLKYGERGFLCWGAFSVLATWLSGGHVWAAATLALLAGSRATGHEPLTVLVVSFLASALVYKHTFPGKVNDTQVVQRPYEQKIRDILFRIDPSRLHLVDGELDKFKGREKDLFLDYQQLLHQCLENQKHERRESRRLHEPNSNDTAASSTSSSGGGGAPAPSIVQVAHDEETRRIQETIRARLELLSKRSNGRR